MGVYSSPFENIDMIFWPRATWKLKFVWWPTKCDISGKTLWLKYAYCGTAMWTGPGDLVFEHHWLSKHEYLIAKLTDKI